MNYPRNNMKSTTIGSFAALVDSYINEYDSDNIMSLFPSLSSYRIEELIGAFSDERNYRYYEEAKKVINEYSNYISMTRSVFFHADEINIFTS